jgi:hypothetical protein
MSVAPVTQVVTVDLGPPPAHESWCPICLTGQRAGTAYRPHTLTPACWCIPKSSIKPECEMTRNYGMTA